MAEKCPQGHTKLTQRNFVKKLCKKYDWSCSHALFSRRHDTNMLANIEMGEWTQKYRNYPQIAKTSRNRSKIRNAQKYRKSPKIGNVQKFYSVFKRNVGKISNTMEKIIFNPNNLKKLKCTKNIENLKTLKSQKYR